MLSNTAFVSLNLVSMMLFFWMPKCAANDPPEAQNQCEWKMETQP